MFSMVNIRKITEIKPIPDVQVVDCICMGGWSAIGRKFQYEVGDYVVHFLHGAIVPNNDIFKSVGIPNLKPDGTVESYNIVNQKYRNKFYDGVIFPLYCFKELNNIEIVDGTYLDHLLCVSTVEQFDKSYYLSNNVQDNLDLFNYKDKLKISELLKGNNVRIEFINEKMKITIDNYSIDLPKSVKKYKHKRSWRQFFFDLFNEKIEHPELKAIQSVLEEYEILYKIINSDLKDYIIDAVIVDSVLYISSIYSVSENKILDPFSEISFIVKFNVEGTESIEFTPLYEYKTLDDLGIKNIDDLKNHCGGFSEINDKMLKHGLVIVYDNQKVEYINPKAFNML